MQKRASPSLVREPASESPLDGGHLFRAVFDNALDAMLIADDTGNYIDANPAAIQDLRFRRALSHAMDRQQLVETLQSGLSPVAADDAPVDLKAVCARIWEALA